MCGAYARLNAVLVTVTNRPAFVVRGYCLAVRGSLTNDGRPPLDASGLKLQERLSLIEDSLERVAEKGGYQNP